MLTSRANALPVNDSQQAANANCTILSETPIGAPAARTRRTFHRACSRRFCPSFDVCTFAALRAKYKRAESAKPCSLTAQDYSLLNDVKRLKYLASIQDLTLSFFCVIFRGMDRKRNGHEPKFTRQMTLADFDRMFPDEAACKDYLIVQRWPDGVRCPRCGNAKLYALKTRPYHWLCKACGKTPYRFSLYVHTVFENTNYPLRTWFKVLYYMLVSKKGVSAAQIHRMIGSGSYQTAWYLCMRLRASLQDPDFRKLMGIVEVDETYIGGLNANRPLRKRFDIKGRGQVGKTTVIGAISRKGNVTCRIIEGTSIDAMTRFVRDVVSDKVSLVATDEAAGFRYLGRHYPHDTVDHKANEYVRGEVHTNNIESFWSLLKRGVMGTFHNISKDYLPLYLAEFQFRHNNRKNPDIFRTILAGC
jgi:transposase-like protein